MSALRSLRARLDWRDPSEGLVVRAGEGADFASEGVWSCSAGDRASGGPRKEQGLDQGDCQQNGKQNERDAERLVGAVADTCRAGERPAQADQKGAHGNTKSRA